ncbi:MAG: hypothetical protein K2N12_03095 [Helicobacter sp.]|nr:hypothetical protein [Helicobacter sp.]
MTLELELPKEAQEAYSHFAKEQNITKEELMQRALLEYLEDLEDLAIALRGREERLNGDVGEPWENVKKELGL